MRVSRTAANTADPSGIGAHDETPPLHRRALTAKGVAVVTPALRFLKFAIPVAIIVWLVASVDRDQLSRLWLRDKNWPLLTAGFALAMAAICLSFLRWYLLVRTLGLPFRLSDAFRLGFLGYVLNFVGAGSTGGDLFKAVFIAQQQTGRRTEAVATVMADRVVGLFALLLVTSVAVFVSDVSRAAPVVRAICSLTLWATVAAAGFALLLLTPLFGHGRLAAALGRIPKLGSILEKLLLVVRVYREKQGTLALIVGMSLGVHALLPLALYLAAVSIFDHAPTLAEHYVIVPMSVVAGALPFTPAGLGTFELAMESLYTLVPAEASGDGIILALIYRMMTILVAAIGVVYYWSSRREVAQLLQEAELKSPQLSAGA
jgi:uncharacterized protein (TIRG00374 family)